MSSITNKFDDMQTHPDNYSDEHLESMMNHIDKPVDVEEKWRKFEAKHFGNNPESNISDDSAKNTDGVSLNNDLHSPKKIHLWRNVAAVVACVFLITGVSFATKGAVAKFIGESKLVEIEPYAFNEYKLPPISGEDYADKFDNDSLQKVIEDIDITRNYKMFHEVYNTGCSWYCGGIPKKAKASSTLKENGAISCDPQNVNDFNLHTAWVEGAEGQGIGEYLEIIFDKESIPFNEIHIVNGYAKKQRIWEENSRVKELKVYYNDTPVCVLKLKDTRDEQLFKVDMIGPKDISKSNKDWVVKFEIRDVYPGTKYEDTAITEILFDGPCH